MKVVRRRLMEVIVWAMKCIALALLSATNVEI
jgi:hypothetical protein